MRPVTVPRVGVGVSPSVPVDIYSPSSSKSILVEVVSGAATYTVEATLDDIFNPAIVPVWVPVGGPSTPLVGATTTQWDTTQAAARAFRLNQTAGTGTTRMTIAQQSLA